MLVTSAPLFYEVSLGVLLMVIATFPVLLKINAPYGRFQPNSSWTIPTWFGWLIMEAPSPICFAIFAFQGMQSEKNTLQFWLPVAMWLIHYINRSFVYPFRVASPWKPMNIDPVISAIIFNLANGSANGYALVNPPITLKYLTFLNVDMSVSASVDFVLSVVGVCVFTAGVYINLQSDTILRNLRKNGDSGYLIPRGGWFERVSCANYLGELLEWLGFALVTHNTASILFLFATAANLIPRALATHAFYKDKFDDYPRNRKAILPMIL